MKTEGAITITIDPETCKKDGLCARVCPARQFEWKERERPVLAKEDRCVLCGQCMAICPSGSIRHSRLDITRFERIEDRHPVDPEAFMHFLGQRRSVRSFKKDPVPRETLEKVVGCIGLAPTGAFGGPGWVRRAVIVTGDENLAKVRDMTAEYIRKMLGMLDGIFVKAAARFNAEARGGLATLPDVRMRVAELEAGRDPILYGAPAAVFLHSPKDTSTPQEDNDAAVMYILMAAHAHGLGACWNGYLQHAAAGDFFKGFTKLAAFLGIPEGNRVCAAAIIGWPALKLHSVPPREAELRWVV